MGQYLSPPNPGDFETKCAIIFYPDDDGAFYLNALRGQLSELAAWWVWEGDRQKRDEISQIWLEHDLMTDAVFFRIDCDDVPLVLGDEKVNINVTTNCGCCDGPSFNDELSPIVDPEAEFPDDVRDGTDPNGDVPETLTDIGIETWSEFDERACKMATAFVELLIRLIASMDGAGNIASKVGGLLALLSYAAPGTYATIVGRVHFSELIEALLTVFGFDAVIDQLGQLVEDLQGGLGEEVKCFVYQNRHSINVMQGGLPTVIYDWMIETAYDGDLATAVQGLVDAYFPLRWLFGTFFGDALAELPTGADCSSCGASSAIYTDIFEGGQQPTWAVINRAAIQLDALALAGRSGFGDGIAHQRLSLLRSATGQGAGQDFVTQSLEFDIWYDLADTTKSASVEIINKAGTVISQRLFAPGEVPTGSGNALHVVMLVPVPEPVGDYDLDNQPMTVVKHFHEGSALTSQLYLDNIAIVGEFV